MMMSELIERLKEFAEQDFLGPYQPHHHMALNLLSECKEALKQSQWVSVEDRLPKKKCIARYINSHGNERTIMADYVDRFTVEADSDCDSDEVSEYCEEKDTWYYKEGWWEVIDNWDDYHMVSVHQGEVTHWMPLPTPPAKEQG
jgi:hypothetical protein